MIDFKKSFNRQNHAILVTKLGDIGVPGWLLNILVGFLNDRELVVNYKGGLQKERKICQVVVLKAQCWAEKCWEDETIGSTLCQTETIQYRRRLTGRRDWPVVFWKFLLSSLPHLRGRALALWWLNRAWLGMSKFGYLNKKQGHFPCLWHTHPETRGLKS